MAVLKTAVVGAGTMGSSIALAIAAGQMSVILKDTDDQALERGLKTVDRLLEARVNKGLSRVEAEKQRSLIIGATDFRSFQDLNLVIEAVPEKIELKKLVLQDLDKRCSAQTIIASNTSSLSITQLAAFTSRPDKLIGLHFFNPAHLMKLVEIIPGLDTSEATVSTAMNFAESLGKVAIRVEECASFLVNRLLGRYANEALFVLEENRFSVEQIDDAACKYVMPIGPLALRDMNGADIGLAVANFNYQEYGERFKPAPILTKLVERNLLGQKTLSGIYSYDQSTRKRNGANPALQEIIGKTDSYSAAQDFDVERLFLPMINEAFLVMQEKICATEDLDKALIAGLGMRKGPLMLAQEIGLAKCLVRMERLFETYGERFRPAPLLKRFVWAGRKYVI